MISCFARPSNLPSDVALLIMVMRVIEDFVVAMSNGNKHIGLISTRESISENPLDPFLLIFF